MNPPFSEETLHQLLYQYYPVGLHADDPAYKESEQARRLTQRLSDASQDMSAWTSFVQHVREELPGCTFWDATLLFLEPCFRLRVQLPETAHDKERCDEVVCLLSVLAPVYVIYASHSVGTGASGEAWTRYPPLPSAFQSYEARLAGFLESTFGATRLPEEMFLLPVPELDPRGGNVPLGKARLIDLLFTSQRW